jgi:hypothetical protein
MRSIGFLLVALAALLLAGFLTYNIANPKEVKGYSTLHIGSLPDAPTNQAYGKGTIVFGKAEDEKND